MRGCGHTDMAGFGTHFVIWRLLLGLQQTSTYKDQATAGKRGQSVQVTFFPAGELH